MALSVGASIVVTVGLALWIYGSTGVPGALALEPTVGVDVHGREIGALRPGSDEVVGVDDLPDHVVEGVLAAEDRSFRDHGGVSVSGTAGPLPGTRRRHRRGR